MPSRASLVALATKASLGVDLEKIATLFLRGASATVMGGTKCEGRSLEGGRSVEANMISPPWITVIHCLNRNICVAGVPSENKIDFSGTVAILFCLMWWDKFFQVYY